MKVVARGWGGESYRLRLEDALRPQIVRDGAVETAAARADAALTLLGNLLATLVEKGVITLDESSEVTGEYSAIEMDNDDIPF